MIDIEIMNITNTIGGNEEKRAKEDVKAEAMRFMWIPGKRPVIVPTRIPIRRARISGNISSLLFQ